MTAAAMPEAGGISSGRTRGDFDPSAELVALPARSHSETGPAVYDAQVHLVLGLSEREETDMKERTMQKRARLGLFGILGAVALATMSWVVMASMASAAPDALTGVTICHATGSNTNPYVTNSPSTIGDFNGHAGHTGPIWDPTAGPSQPTWGDIIPPLTVLDNGVFFAGLNWTAAGQAIWNNGCAPVPTTTTTTTPPTTTTRPATTTTAAPAVAPKAVTVTPSFTG
jgi:hypothetical protein